MGTARGDVAGLASVARDIKNEHARLALMRLSFAAVALVSAVSLAWVLPWTPFGLTEAHYGASTLTAFALLIISAAAWPTVFAVWAAKFRGESTPEFLRVIFGGRLLVRGQGQFLSRLQLECRRGQRKFGHSFTLIVMTLTGDDRDVQRPEQHVATMLVRGIVRSEDVVGELGLKELAALTFGSHRAEGEGIIARLGQGMSAAGMSECRIGSASFPEDANEPEALLSAARTTQSVAGTILNRTPSLVTVLPQPEPHTGDALPEFLLSQLREFKASAIGAKLPAGLRGVEIERIQDWQDSAV